MIAVSREGADAWARSQGVIGPALIEEFQAAGLVRLQEDEENDE